MINVINFKVNENSMSKATHKVTIAIDKQLQLTGSIKVVKNFLNLPEAYPKCEMSDELKKQLGYLTSEELEAMQKVVQNAKIWDNNYIHIFEISGTRDSFKDSNDNTKWIDHIYWQLAGRPFDRVFNIRMKQVLYQSIIEQVVSGNVRSEKSLPFEINESGEMVLNEEYYEEIPKELEISFMPGRRNKDGSIDWNKVLSELDPTGKTNTYRGYGKLVITNPRTKISLYVHAVIRQFTNSGKWYLSTPGVNINRMRAMEVEGWSNFFELDDNGNMKSERLKEGVKFEDLPDGLKKLVNQKNNRLFLNTMEFVNFRGNNTVAFSDELNRDAEGSAIGPVILTTGFVKKEVLAQFFEVAKQHGLSFDPAMSEESNMQALDQIGQVINS